MPKFFLIPPGPRYSWRKVVCILSLSSALVLASAYYFFYRYDHKEEKTICAIVQTSCPVNALNTAYLAEVMGLSINQPIYLNQFDLKKAQELLLATSIIEKVELKKIKPDVLYMDYMMRQPIAYSADWTYTAIDEKGIFFPSTPFYSPRHLTEIYLGELAPSTPWGESMEQKLIEVAKQLLACFENHSIKRIDLSQIKEKSSGKRQIVIVLKTGRILRLTPKNYAQELSNYFILETALFQEDSNAAVIDLRIPEVAYIQNIEI